MKDWICIYCGTTMSSKCPGQRSEFFGGEIALIRNALATHVLDVGQNKKEVFLNLSFWGSNTENVDPVIATIEQLAEWKEKLIAVSCNHRFVLNSKERTECQLGHEHHNLNDKETLLAERPAKEEFKVTFEDVKETYISFLGTQMELAKSNMKNLCAEVKRGSQEYDEYRREYFVFQDEMDQIKYALQKGLTRLKHGQPYRKKYEVRFGYNSDIPNLYTDDIFQAEAVYKHYQSRKIKCDLGELRPEKKDSTSINYYPLEMDVDRRVKCCECGERLKPGERAVIADITEQVDDYPRREVHVHNHGEVMHAKCHKKIMDKDKEYHRMAVIQFSDKEMRSFSHYRDEGNPRDITCAMRDRWYDFRHMQVTDCWPAVTKGGAIYGRFHVKLKGLGHQFDELKHYLKPATKKETK
jgi:hypothetical protein